MRYLTGLLLGSALLCSNALWAAASITTQIDALRAASGTPATVGILVKNAQTNEVVYTSRAQEGFSPASITKLLTVAAALSELGADYQFDTSLQYQSAQRAGAVLNGDLYVTFSGDPSLRSQDLIKLIREIKTQGITQINGNIILDNTRFSGPVYGRGWNHDDIAWYYAAPVTSIILDENQTRIQLVSSKTLRGKATITPISADAVVTITSDVNTVTHKEANSLCQFNTEIRPKNTFYFYGCWPQMKEPKIFKLAITEPNLVALNLIEKTLKETGINISGRIKTGTAAPADYQVLAKHASAKLSELVKPVLRDSHNLYADSLTKTLGYLKYQRGTFQAGTSATETILSEKFNVPANSLQIFDGSGLSNYNSVTPEAFGQLLYSIYQNATLKDLYLDALPNNENANSADAGTLRSRLEKWLFKNTVQVKAKTGGMTGISTLAGYIEKPKQPTLIFVIMNNQLLDESAQAKKFQNDLIKILSQ